jgi:hypothetical protein
MQWLILTSWYALTVRRREDHTLYQSKPTSQIENKMKPWHDVQRPVGVLSPGGEMPIQAVGGAKDSGLFTWLFTHYLTSAKLVIWKQICISSVPGEVS